LDFLYLSKVGPRKHNVSKAFEVVSLVERRIFGLDLFPIAQIHHLHDVVLEDVGQVANNSVPVGVEVLVVKLVASLDSVNKSWLIHDVCQIEIDPDHREVVVNQVEPVFATERQDVRSDEILHVSVSKIAASVRELVHVVLFEVVQFLILGFSHIVLSLVSDNLNSVPCNLEWIELLRVCLLTF
jgi:hypothetical protein